MEIGKVKWFNNAKGYGFVVAEGRNEDLFAHYSAIQMDGYRTLKAGQPVQFEIIQGPKGLHAVNIQALGEPVRRSEATASDLATAEYPQPPAPPAVTGIPDTHTPAKCRLVSFCRR